MGCRWACADASIGRRSVNRSPRTPPSHLFSIVTPAKALSYAHISRLHDHPASFDKLRMRGNLGGTKKNPHPEPVEGRTQSIQASCKRLMRLANLCAYGSAKAGMTMNEISGSECDPSVQAFSPGKSFAKDDDGVVGHDSTIGKGSRSRPADCGHPGGGKKERGVPGLNPGITPTAPSACSCVTRNPVSERLQPL